MEKIPSRLFCKDLRISLFGNVNGGKNTINIEKYQRSIVEKITNLKILKSHMRLNIRHLNLEKRLRPNKEENGFDYTENFDGFQKINNKSYYFNFKCIVGKGGSQTRSLRDTYLFIETQMKYLINTNNRNIVFINILDGNESYRTMGKFNYLFNFYNYSEYKKNIYIGDLYSFENWFKSHKSNHFL